ncbi:MAG: YfaZ family outer membrane protein [Pseudomonadota bacterium]
MESSPRAYLNFSMGAAILRFVKSSLLILIGSVMALAVSAQTENDQLLGAKPSLLWLSDDVHVSAIEGLEYESFLGSGELWSDNWGISAKLLENTDDDVFGMPEDSEYFNFDVKRRIFGSKDKSNVELGLGWQEFSIDDQLQASGPKLSVSGRYSFTDAIQLYGETSYFPELEEELTDTAVSGFEFEAGVLYQPIPNISLKAGYRKFSLDIEDTLVEDLGSSSGFLLGTDLSF